MPSKKELQSELESLREQVAVNQTGDGASATLKESPAHSRWTANSSTGVAEALIPPQPALTPSSLGYSSHAAMPPAPLGDSIVDPMRETPAVELSNNITVPTRSQSLSDVEVSAESIDSCFVLYAYHHIKAQCELTSNQISSRLSSTRSYFRR